MPRSPNLPLRPRTIQKPSFQTLNQSPINLLDQTTLTLKSPTTPTASLYELSPKQPPLETPTPTTKEATIPRTSTKHAPYTPCPHALSAKRHRPNWHIPAVFQNLLSPQSAQDPSSPPKTSPPPPSGLTPAELFDYFCTHPGSARLTWMPPAREECGDEATDNEEDRAGDGHMGGVWEGMTTAERLVEIYRNPAAKKVAQEVGLWVVVFGFSKGVFGKV